MTRHNPDAWVGIDLDGTLAYQAYQKNGLPKYDPLFIGDPVKPVLHTARRLLRSGIKVKIFTALEVTATKDKNMIAIIDDRAIQFPHNDRESWSGEHLYQLVQQVIG
jgi:hypothetical protein